MPTPDNARIAPGDRLLYQYSFSSDFGDSVIGQFVNRIVPICSMGGYITSVSLRHAILSASAKCLGFEDEHIYHFGVSLRMLPWTGPLTINETDGLPRNPASKTLLALAAYSLAMSIRLLRNRGSG